MKQYGNRDWLYQKYIIEKLSTIEIGRMCGITYGAIYLWLKKFNIPRRTISEAMKGRNMGKNNPQWKGGRRKTADGYILIYHPDHPYATCKRCVLEHRLVMEGKIGRYLYPWEIVHHINGIRDDNRVENLELLPRGGHSQEMHRLQQENQLLKKENLFLKEQLANFLSIKT